MLSSGAQIGNYIIEEEIGGGGMARVYRVQHAVLHTRHALKVLLPAYRDNPEVRARFLREAMIGAKLLHPNIVRVTDTVSTSDAAGIVMELVNGPSLDQFLKRSQQPPSLAVVRALFLPVLAAVSEAHRQGIVHRDLKPANILLDPGDHAFCPKVTDFGIAKVTESASLVRKKGSTHADARMGTLAYMSPEQVRHSKEVTPRSDIFSLGATLYEMVTGRPAFDGDSDYEVMHQIVEGRFHAVELLKDIDPRFATAIARALRVDPQERFDGCESFAQALGEPALEGPRVAKRSAAEARSPVVASAEPVRTPASVSKPPVQTRAATAPVPAGTSDAAAHTGQRPVKLVAPAQSARSAAPVQSVRSAAPAQSASSLAPAQSASTPAPAHLLQGRTPVVVAVLAVAVLGVFLASSSTSQQSAPGNAADRTPPVPRIGPRPFDGCLRSRAPSRVAITYLTPTKPEFSADELRRWFPGVSNSAIEVVKLQRANGTRLIGFEILRARWPPWDLAAGDATGEELCRRVGQALADAGIGRPDGQAMRNNTSGQTVVEYDFHDGRASISYPVQEPLGDLDQALSLAGQSAMRLWMAGL